MRVRHELQRLVEEEPGLTAAELWVSLSDEVRTSGVDAVKRHLLAMEQGQLVHHVRVQWYPGPSAVRAVSAGEPTEDHGGVREVSEASDIGNLESAIRERLKGRRLVAEVGLDSGLFESVTDAVETSVQRLGVDGVARLYPYVFMTFIVGHGVYGYEAGNYWGRMPIEGIGSSAGRLFADLCKNKHLEDFSHLLASERATKYVAPILAHGGVPKYSLDDFFQVLLSAMRQAGDDAGDILMYWRSRKSAFTHVDKPVARFLLYGGDVSFDFLARCVDAVLFVQRHGRPPSPEDSGLPPYVLVWLARAKDEVKAATPSKRTWTSISRPRLVLDPYSPTGPQIELPTIPQVTNEAWRLSSADGILRRPASSFEPEILGLTPQKSWTVELLCNEWSKEAWTFEGFDEAPVLFFDPASEELVPTTTSLRLESVWMLGPASVQVEALSDVEVAPRLLEEASALTGAWSGYIPRLYWLEECSGFRVSDGDRASRVLVRPVSSRPELRGELVEHVATTDGLPVYRGPVTIEVPAAADLEPEQWVVRVARDGGDWQRFAVDDEFSCVVDPGTSLGTVVVAVHGALGSDLRDRFAVVPDLSVRRPPHLLLPDAQRAAVSISAAGMIVADTADSVELLIPADDDHVSFVISDGANEIELRAQVPRLLWGLVDSSTTSVTFGSRAISASMGQLVDEELAALAVRVGQEGIPLELHLVVDDVTVQVSDRVKSGRADGRWTFDLAPFRDAIRTTDAASATFVLRVGQVPVTVLRLRAEVDVRDLDLVSRVAGDFVHVHASFESTAAQRDRVLRLWSVDRPWDPPLQVPIADGSCEVDTSGYGILPEGRYLAEVVVDDGWTQPVRPRVGADNVLELRIGDRESQEAGLLARDVSDPLVVLEWVLLTGQIRRHLTEEELEKIAPAAMAAVHAFLLEPDPRVTPPRGAGWALQLLALDPTVLAATVTVEAEQNRLDRARSVTLALLLLANPYTPGPSGALADDDVRRLWSASPAIAALIDLVGDENEERLGRLSDVLGWSPADGAESLFTGAPINQMTAGPAAEQLRAMRAMIDLLPKSLLEADALVDVNFDWLIRAKEESVDLDGFWSKWKPKLPAQSGDAHIQRHLAQRTAPDGTFAWASIPRLTLVAAVIVTSEHDGSLRGLGLDLLREAARFAPRLVERDLVLARALNTYAHGGLERDDP